MRPTGRASVLFVVATLLLASGIATAASYSPTYWSPYPPPKPLHKAADGHWTPYQPPSVTPPPPNYDVYIIEPGDTLWGLAGTLMGDNLLWPFLAEMNPYIRDPHWIFPGDPIFVQKVQVIQQGELKKEKPYELPGLFSAFRPALTSGEINCGHFITDDWTKYDTVILSCDDPAKTYMASWDSAYINKGSADGVKPGDDYAILRFDENVRHPDDFHRIGEAIGVVGRARVVCTREHDATILLVEVCREIEPGYRLRPWNELVSPLVPRDLRVTTQCPTPSNLARGTVVFIQESRMLASQRIMISLDVGAAEGLLPGDRMTVFRDELDYALDLEREVYGGGVIKKKDRIQPRRIEESVFDNAFANDRGTWRRMHKAVYANSENIRRTVGEVVVLYTEDHTSTVSLLTSRQELLVGDDVEFRIEEEVRPPKMVPETYVEVPPPAPAPPPVPPPSARTAAQAPAPPPPAVAPPPPEEVKVYEGLRYKLKSENGGKKKTQGTKEQPQEKE